MPLKFLRGGGSLNPDKVAIFYLKLSTQKWRRSKPSRDRRENGVRDWSSLRRTLVHWLICLVCQHLRSLHKVRLLQRAPFCFQSSMIQELQWETSVRYPKVLRCTRVPALVYCPSAWFFFNLRVFIEDQPEKEEQETMRSKDSEFAAVKLPRCLVCGHDWRGNCRWGQQECLNEPFGKFGTVLTVESNIEVGTVDIQWLRLRQGLKFGITVVRGGRSRVLVRHFLSRLSSTWI